MKKSNLIFVFLCLLNSVVIVAQSDKLVMDNYLKANAILQKAIDKQGGYKKITTPVKFGLEGTKYFFGHYDTPEKTKAVPDTGIVAFFPDWGIAYSYSGIEYYGQRSKIILNHKDSSYYYGYFARGVEKGKLSERHDMFLTLPAQALLFAYQNKKTLFFVGEDSQQNIIGFNDDSKTRFNLCIDKKTDRLQKVIQISYHDIYGDGSDEVIYEYFKVIDLQPSKLMYKEHGILEGSFNYTNFKYNGKIDTAFVQSLCPTCKVENTTQQTLLTLDKIDKNLWVVAINNLDNKVLLAEFKDYLVVFEAPNNAETCQKMIEFIKEKFPNKPIKSLAVSHHHPDHAGGFTAFTNNNISLITTKGNTAFFEKLLKMQHTLQESNTVKIKKINIQTIASNDSLSLKDSDNQVIMYESGENTDHVKEYLFFYFPLQKILFVGDLVIFPQSEVMEQDKRAYCVYSLIQNKKLNVEKIYTSWPLKDQKAFGTMEDLKAALKKAYPSIGSN